MKKCLLRLSHYMRDIVLGKGKQTLLAILGNAIQS